MTWYDKIKNKLYDLLLLARPISFPFTMAIIIPFLYIILGEIYPNYSDIIENILWGINVIILFWLFFYMSVVFFKRRGDAKIMKNAIDLRNNVKVLLYGSVIVAIVLFVFDFLHYGTFLTTLNVEQFPNHFDAKLKFTINGATLAVLFGLLVINLTTLEAKFHFGLSFAYFKATQQDLEEGIKEYFTNEGLSVYNKFLGETIDLKMKNMDNLLTVFIIDKFGNSEFKIKKLLEQYEKNSLAPMRYLANVSGQTEMEFLTKRPDFESLERIVRTIAPIVTMIAIVVGVLLTYFLSSNQ